MGVRFLRFDILPSSPHGGLEEDDLEEAEAGGGEGGGEQGGEGGEEAGTGKEAGELGGGGARQQDHEEADEAFCHVIEPGKAGVRRN